MFQSSRSRLLLYYLAVMAAILSLFSAAFFVLFSRSLYHQVDENLETLVRVAVPSFTQVSTKGSEYLENLDEVPWRDIFNSEQQRLEWFDAQGKLLASQGNLKLLFPPKSGFWTLQGEEKLMPYQIRTFTLSVAIDRSTQGQSTLEGFIRSAQTTQEVQQVQDQFLWQLGISVLTVLGLIALSGIWLTRKALEPVMQSFKQLQQFTADASHELRGPLTAIKASVDVMQNHPERFGPKDAKKLAAINSATEQMTHLTQDLLFLARSEAKGGLAEGEWHCLALDDLLDDLFEWLEPVAEAKDIHFNYHCHCQAKIKGDRAQLSRLFANLLENALNYTPQGGKITLRLVQQNQTAAVIVEDTGIGISQDSLPYVFDRFWRADRARSHRQGGSGLGLSIAQAIARRHGGQIAVSSQIDRGSRFQVVLPLYRPEATNSMTHWRSWQNRQLPQLLRSDRSRHLLRKLALATAIATLSILPICMLVVALTQAETFDGLKFPQGGISFADQVVFYQPKAEVAPMRLNDPPEDPYNPFAALGIPNAGREKRFPFFQGGHHQVDLKGGGSLIVKFTDNLLSGSNSSDSDLWIFTSGSQTIPLAVAISQDGRVWHNVGYVDARQGGIDLDRWSWGKKDFFSYVRLTYEAPTEHASHSEAVAIDAVGAVTAVKIIPSTTSLLSLSSPLVRTLMAAIVVLGLSVGGRYWWERKKTLGGKTQKSV